ncbi:MAG: FGGY family carbohydrate kinase, partial [Henriciella sp.]
MFDAAGQICALAQQEFPQHFPKSGWVEHDPADIWESTLATARTALARAEAGSMASVACIGITNQRETTLIWDTESGRTVGNAIVWQDRRTADICAELRQRGLEEEINRRTGLTLDPYFSGTKLIWLLRNSEEARDLASQGR